MTYNSPVHLWYLNLFRMTDRCTFGSRRIWENRSGAWVWEIVNGPLYQVLIVTENWNLFGINDASAKPWLGTKQSLVLTTDKTLVLLRDVFYNRRHHVMDWALCWVMLLKFEWIWPNIMLFCFILSICCSVRFWKSCTSMPKTLIFQKTRSLNIWNYSR